MEIQQRATVERQAFEAMMRIHNGYDQHALTNVTIRVQITDADGEAVTWSSNPQQTNASFFARVDSLQGVTAASNGVVPPSAVAEIHWLLIPSQGAGGTNALGKAYGIGAQLDYWVGGQEYNVKVKSEWVVVRPMPKLTLNYYLPEQVYGDDPYTPAIEESVPFPLGLRVDNTGAGISRNLTIESAQPQIVDNRLGLLVGFDVHSSSVQGLPAQRTLRARFGDIPGQQVRVAHWEMTASLMGQFTNFTASFTHADELGGELTSLIETTRVHSLVRDILVDLPGRDGVRDFLIRSGSGVVAHESDRLPDLAVRTVAAQAATLTAMGSTESTYQYRLGVPPTNQPFYVRLPFAEASDKEVAQAVRHDGKVLNPANVWISKHRENGEQPWEYEFHLFDVNGGGDYNVTFRRIEIVGNVPPVLAHVGNKVTWEGEEIGFLVQASDPNGTVPTLGAVGLPAGATFTQGTNGTGTFLWQTQVGDYGVHPVRFTASDGQFSVWKLGRIYVGRPGEPLAPNGLPESLANWKPAIKDLSAMSGAGEAEVKWESVEGVPYELYWSDQPYGTNMVWTRATREVSSGPETEALDPTLGQARLRRFYQVVIEGDAPDLHQVWGVIRRDVPPGFSMISPPVRTDRRFDGEMGLALAEELTGNDGGIGAGGDEVYALQGDGSWRMLYLDSTGTWREANGTPSTYELPAGTGLWVARKQGVPARLTFTGPVGNDGTQRVTLQPGFNLIGLSEGKDLPLAATLATAGPVGGAWEEEADQLIIQQANGSWRFLMHVAHWGPMYDGRWFDLGTYQFVPTSEVLQPGAAYYYLRRGGEADIQF